MPLAIPSIAGPSALATVMLMVSRNPSQHLRWIVALTAAMVVATIVLLASYRLQRVLGERGMVAVERLMGLVLTALAVQMLLDGVRTFVTELRTVAPTAEYGVRRTLLPRKPAGASRPLMTRDPDEPSPLTQRYDRAAIALHWITALLVVANLTLGLSMVGLPISPRKLHWYLWHKTIGLTVFLLTSVRLAMARVPPASAAGADAALAAASDARCRTLRCMRCCS